MKHLIASLILINAVTPAYANITDLPDPGQIEDTYSATQRSSVALSKISRKTGGETIELKLKRPLELTSLEVFVKNQSIKIYSATLTTVEGRNIDIRGFSNTAKLEVNAVYLSENLNLREKVSKVTLVAEAFGDSAELQFAAISNSGKSEFSISRSTAEKKPNTQTPEKPTPKPPTQVPQSKPAPPKPTPVYSVGTLVIIHQYSYPEIGSIEEIYENGTYKVYMYTSQPVYVSKSDLNPATKCSASGTLCANAEVTFADGFYDRYDEGKVLAHYDGWVFILSLDSKTLYRKEERLVSMRRSCAKNYSSICVGTEIVYDHYGTLKTARVKRILPKDEVELDNSFRIQSNQAAKNIKTSCAGNLCIGNRGFFAGSTWRYKGAGVVVKVYGAQLLELKMDNGETVYSTPESFSKAK